MRWSVAQQRYGGANVLRVKVTGVAGVPASGVGAVSLNVTVVDPVAAGVRDGVSVWDRPMASNLNYVAGQMVPNAVIAPVSAAGEVCFFSSATTHLVADVNGWFAAGSGFAAVSPLRVFDTRPTEAQGAVAVAKQKYGGANVLRVKVTGVGGGAGVGCGCGVVERDGGGSGGAGVRDGVSVWGRADGVELNYVAGQTVPNAVIAPVSAAGEVCFFCSATTHLLADVNGWFAAGSGFTALSPLRVFDTRPGAQGCGGRWRAAVWRCERVAGEGDRGGWVPASGVGAVSLNVTAVDPVARGS